MKFETENPKLVQLLGCAIALAAVALGATVAKDHVAGLWGLAGTVLGVVGIQIGQKS